VRLWQCRRHAQPDSLAPDPGAIRSASVTALMRACAAAMAAAFDKSTTVDDVFRHRWPHDRDAARLLETRAAVSPTTTASFSALMSRTIADFLDSLTPASAGAALLGQGLQLTFGSNVSISVPAFVAAAANVGWVDEGAPVPVRQLNVLGGPMLQPDKLAALCALSNEMLSGSNAEVLVRDALTQSAALALDTALLDANASTSARPAGLRYGISTLTASVLTDRTEAMLADIATVAGGVAPAGNAPIVLIAGPVRAMTLRLRAPRELPVTMLATSAVGRSDCGRTAGARLRHRPRAHRG
jgi:HK97 family phage major capsid protein